MRALVLLASAALTTGLVLANPAHAGGVGLVGAGGLHEGRAYYYRDDGQQGIDIQNRPNLGGGVEIMLGDRDDRVIGMMRMYTITDWPLKEPDLSAEDSSHEYTYPPAHDEPKSTVGALTIGVQWGLWGDPAGFQLIGHTLIGSGFITKNNLEFAIAEPGVGVVQTFNERYQVYGTAAFTMRFRKQLSLGENVYVGVRYMFD